MPKKKSSAPPPALHTSDVVRFLGVADSAFERIQQLDPLAGDLLGDLPRLRQTGKLLMGALRGGGVVIMPPVRRESYD